MWPWLAVSTRALGPQLLRNQGRGLTPDPGHTPVGSVWWVGWGPVILSLIVLKVGNAGLGWNWHHCSKTEKRKYQNFLSPGVALCVLGISPCGFTVSDSPVQMAHILSTQVCL